MTHVYFIAGKVFTSKDKALIHFERLCRLGKSIKLFHNGKLMMSYSKKEGRIRCDSQPT